MGNQEEYLQTEQCYQRTESIWHLLIITSSNRTYVFLKLTEYSPKVLDLKTQHNMQNYRNDTQYVLWNNAIEQEIEREATVKSSIFEK